MDELRRPFLILAIVLMAIAVLFEIGSTALIKGVAADVGRLREIALEEANRDDDDELEPGDVDDVVEDAQELSEDEDPPGRAIQYLAFLDGLLLYAVGMMGLSLVAPERVQGRVQGIVGLIVSIVLIILLIIAIVFAVVLLMIMVGLLTAVPFGTIAYFAIYGFFDRAGASVVLGLIMLLKLGFCVSLVLAQQRFLQNKSIVLLTLTSLLASVIVAFLHGIVPLFLVSITDGIAAIVIAVLAIIWAIVMLIASIVSIVKLIL
ncbi:MAG: hypothetical protein M3134_08220 [Actinomycetota bacterium]|nr:hypothetical protein [Actinomycetota bacterium]